MRNDEIEGLLGAIESYAAPFWCKVSDGISLQEEEREKFALFLAAQYLRSPSSVRAGAEMTAYFAHHTMQFITANKDVHERAVDNYETKTGKIVPPEDREKMRRFSADPNNFTINILRAAGLPVLSSMGKLADIFCHMKWVVGRSKDQHLITSDSPVTRTSDPATHSPIYGDGAFANKTVRVNFPLSPCRMLEMTWKGEERNRVVEIPKRMAREMNGVRAAHAERFVYCCQRDTGIEKLCDKWLEGGNVPKIMTEPDTPKIEVKRRL